MRFIYLVFLIILFSCKNQIKVVESSNKSIKALDTLPLNLPAKKADSTIYEIQENSKVISKVVKREFKEYHSPKDLNEISKNVYVVDTLIFSKKKNEIADDKNEYLCYFNKIIGIDTLNEFYENKISLIKKNSFYDPEFKVNGIFYLPFNIREDESIITKWEQGDSTIKYVSQYKNIFYHKYGRMKIVDVLEIYNKKYILIETYTANEDTGFQRIVLLTKEMNKDILNTLYSKSLNSKQEDNNSCCKLELIDNSINIRIRSLENYENNQLIKSIKTENNLKSR